MADCMVTARGLFGPRRRGTKGLIQGNGSNVGAV